MISQKEKGSCPRGQAIFDSKVGQEIENLKTLKNKLFKVKSQIQQFFAFNMLKEGKEKG